MVSHTQEGTWMRECVARGPSGLGFLGWGRGTRSRSRLAQQRSRDYIHSVPLSGVLWLLVSPGSWSDHPRVGLEEWQGQRLARPREAKWASARCGDKAKCWFSGAGFSGAQGRCCPSPQGQGLRQFLFPGLCCSSSCLVRIRALPGLAAGRSEDAGEAGY